MIVLLNSTTEQGVASLKKCSKCKADLPLEEYYKHPKTADGYLEKCKPCHRSFIGQNRLKNLERIRQYDRDRAANPTRKARQVETTRRWREADPRRAHCHNAVRYAVKTGQLIKTTCARCNHEKAYAHHDSYDEPLNVMWLCQPCHKQRHKELDSMGIKP